MSINDKHVYMVMYDLPANNPEECKAYRFFRKTLLGFGAYQLQESVYLIHLTTKEQALHIRQELEFCAPKGSNVRCLMLTQRIFETMEMIAGSHSTAEQLLSNKTRIIEF